MSNVEQEGIGTMVGGYVPYIENTRVSLSGGYIPYNMNRTRGKRRLETSGYIVDDW